MSKAMIKNQNNSYVLNAKKKLLKVILNHIETKQFKQKEIQDLFNIKQPRVSDLVNKKLEKFSLDALLMYLYNIEYSIVCISSTNLTDYIENIKIRMIRNIKEMISFHGYKQREIADILTIKQPRVSDLINNKFEKFSIDTLFVYIYRFGYKFSLLEISKYHIDIKFTQTNKKNNQYYFATQHIKLIKIAA